jgi:hypothetical protein
VYPQIVDTADAVYLHRSLGLHASIHVESARSHI